MERPKKKQIPKKHPGGRPEKYRPEFCELAGRGCMLGDTNDVLATRFGVNVATIKRWMNKYPEFCAAIKKGREEDREAMERHGQAGATEKQNSGC